MAPLQTERQPVPRCPDWSFGEGSGADWGQWMETPQLKEIQGDPASRTLLAHCVSSAGLDLKDEIVKIKKTKTQASTLQSQVQHTASWKTYNSTSLEISEGYAQKKWSLP